MNLNWFKDPEHVVYADVEEFIENFAKETGIDDLREKIEAFDAHPTKEGLTLKGKKRTTIRLFIPDLVFDEHIEMGENIWIYMGESYECYCLYGLGDKNFCEDAKEYKFFRHRDCEYFPCHHTEEEDNFNCLFCYCPLYAMGRECGGNFFYLDNGVKDCSGCAVPHKRSNYDYMMRKLTEFHRILRENDDKKTES